MHPLADIHRCKTGSQTNQPKESVVSVTRHGAAIVVGGFPVTLGE
jgi:hypothetical protein